MDTPQKIMIGKLLRANNCGFVAGCRALELQIPSLGMLVKVPIEGGTEIYGLISDISITDDGLVRQIVSGVNIPTEYTADNRYNRNLPVEISVLAVGYQISGKMIHLLPPRPPLSLDMMYVCDQDELVCFTKEGHFGYLRHILRAVDMPVGEILAAHLRMANQAHLAAGDQDWFSAASKEIITLLRDDYQTLMSVLSALADA